MDHKQHVLHVLPSFLSSIIFKLKVRLLPLDYVLYDGHRSLEMKFPCLLVLYIVHLLFRLSPLLSSFVDMYRPNIFAGICSFHILEICSNQVNLRSPILTTKVLSCRVFRTISISQPAMSCYS